jgi:hypothetical protein
LATFVVKMVFYFRIEGVIARIFLKIKVSCKYKEISIGILLFRILPKETDKESYKKLTSLDICVCVCVRVASLYSLHIISALVFTCTQQQCLGYVTQNLCFEIFTPNSLHSFLMEHH